MKATLQATLLVILAVCCGSGAGCPRLVEQITYNPTRRIPATASLDEIIAVVNANSAGVQSLYSTDATIHAAGMPAVSAKIAYEEPTRIRVTAETALTGKEVDLGSNEDLFWLWVRRNDPPALYYCRHDQFAGSAVRNVIPVEPHWFAEALGVVQLDPAAQHWGPTTTPEGRLAVQTYMPREDGMWLKVTIIDPVRGDVVEQHLHDPSGHLQASVLASGHQRDPATNVSLPREVAMNWPSTGFSMRLKIRSLQVNALPEQSGGGLWSLPQGVSDRYVDLGRMPDYATPPPSAAGSYVPRMDLSAEEAVMTATASGGTVR